MPDEIVSPEAPEATQQALPGTETQVPDAPEAAAATAEVTPPKKQRDRVSEMGRRLAEAERLALATASENQRLKDQLDRFGQYIGAQQQAAWEARLSELPPEQQTIELSRQLRQLQMRQAAPVPQEQPHPVQDTNTEAMRILADANSTYDLDGDEALTGYEPELHYSRHATRESFLKTAYQLARQRAEGQEEAVPEKKPAAKQAPNQQDSVAEVIQKEMAKIRQELGIGRPNTASPLSGTAVSPEISDLNKIASRTDLGPQAKIKALKEAAAK